MTGNLYVRKNNSDVIYTVSGTKAACFELTRAELFGAFNPAGLTASEIDAVSYTLADGETVTLKANSEPAAESGSNALPDCLAAGGGYRRRPRRDKGGCYPLGSLHLCLGTGNRCRPGGVWF